MQTELVHSGIALVFMLTQRRQIRGAEQRRRRSLIPSAVATLQAGLVGQHEELEEEMGIQDERPLVFHHHYLPCLPAVRPGPSASLACHPPSPSTMPASPAGNTQDSALSSSLQEEGQVSGPGGPGFWALTSSHPI